MKAIATQHEKPVRIGALLTATLLLAAVLAAAPAGAGWFGKNKDKAEAKTAPHRFNRFPTSTFTQGTLYRGALGGWRLDERAVHLAPSCLVSGDGDASALQEGRPAIVSGTVAGDIIIATHIRMLKPDWLGGASQSAEVVKSPSEGDPTVGILEQAPQ